MRKNQASYEKELPNRIDKALAWLADSRDKWREKCKEAKLLLKRQNLAVKRLRNSRDVREFSIIQFKQESIISIQKVSLLQQRVDELESQIELYRKENQELKKKQ